MRPSPRLLACAVALPAAAAAYTWGFDTPRQCQNVSFSVQGTDGQPPYSVLIVPFGPTPLSNGVEPRRPFSVQFDSGDSVSFQLKYPENSQFVAVVSDKRGFGSGGTSVPVTVQDSDDSMDSCFDPNVSSEGSFVYDITGTLNKQLVQCGSTRLWWWGHSTGTVNFVGLIPGGDAWSIPAGPISTIPEQGTGFNWTVDVRLGTTVVLVAGDDGGMGTGGSATLSVGFSFDSDCLGNDSPSSTQVPAAGSPTQSVTAVSQPTGTDSDRNYAAIIGGACGGAGFLLIVAVILARLYFRQRQRIRQNARSIPIENDDSGPPDPFGAHAYSAVEPFPIREHLNGSTSYLAAVVDQSQRLVSHSSATTSTSGGTPFMRPAAYRPGPSTSKSPFSMYPISVVQHEDGGRAMAEDQGHTVVVEIPPAYTNVQP